MSALTVMWVHEDETDSYTGARNLGSAGGWFKDGMRWKDYLEVYLAEFHPHLEAIRASVIENEIWRGGDWHQGGEGVPVLSDGVYFCASFRAWGDLLAAIWSEHFNVDYSYMDFYLDACLKDKPSTTVDFISR